MTPPAARNPKNRITASGFEGESSLGFSAATKWSGPCSVAVMSVMGASGGDAYGKGMPPCVTGMRRIGFAAGGDEPAGAGRPAQGRSPKLRRRKAARSPGHLCARKQVALGRLLVVLSVVLRGLVAMMGRMQSMRMRDMGVMSRLLVIAFFVVLGRFTMMVRGSLMMLGRGLVVAATLVRLRAHVDLLSLGYTDAVQTAIEI
jgi:hypothetical protein